MKTGKTPYRIRNWKAYNRALIGRGSLTFWFSEDAIAAWHKQKRQSRGRPCLYSDAAIECILMLKAVYHLPLRAAQGLVLSLIQLLNLPLQTPDYSTVCRRQKRLSLPLMRARSSENLHAVFDSTGLKVFGDGEWKVRQHGISRRRTWRKLHLAVDETRKEILAAVLTSNDFKDSELVPDLLDQIAEPITQVSADGAYDDFDTFESLNRRGIVAAIPPRKNARIRQHGNVRHSAPLARDQVLRQIRKKGRARWKKDSGYHRRSIAETTMFRMKQLFGDRLNARLFESQAQEAFAKCNALNKMTSLGMPHAYPIC